MDESWKGKEKSAYNKLLLLYFELYSTQHTTINIKSTHKKLQSGSMSMNRDLTWQIHV